MRYTESILMRHHEMDLLMGGAVAVIFFGLLVFAGWDETAAEVVIGTLIFLVYTQAPFYRAKHSAKPRAVFISFLWYVLGISAGYFALWVILALVLTAGGSPTLSA